MKNLSFLFIFLSTLYSQDNLIINETITKPKTKDFYKKEENLLEEAPKVQENKNKKDKGINIDGNVDVNKENKTIDSVNVNIGSKF